MGKPLVITFDVGTQSARGMIVNSIGDILYKTQKTYTPAYHSTEPGWSEQSADYYWDTICELSKNLKEECGEFWNDIIAVSVTTIRNTVVCVDKKGVPLCDVIVWCDQRQATKIPPLPLTKKTIFKAIGMERVIEEQMASAHCNWLKYHRPELWEKTHKFLMISTYLIYKFTGKFVDADASLTGHVPFNSRLRQWQNRNELTRCFFDIEPEKLCDIVKPGTVIGPITSEASKSTGINQGIELIATGPDKGCETLGLSCNTPDKAALSFGTTATVQVTLDRYLEPVPHFPPYLSLIDGSYSPEIPVTRGYWLISWFKKEFAQKEVEQAKIHGVSAEDLLNNRLSEIPPGCDGLVFQPYFNAASNVPIARGSVVGFSDIHTRIHIYRGIIEGINFALMDGLKTIERRGDLKVKQLFVAGGGSQSDVICQITANMFGLPVNRTQTHEVSGLGSSMVAFTGKGIFKSLEEATEKMVHVKDTFLPDPKVHSVYEKLYNEVFKDIYPRLLPVYKKAKIYQKNSL